MRSNPRDLSHVRELPFKGNTKRYTPPRVGGGEPFLPGGYTPLPPGGGGPKPGRWGYTSLAGRTHFLFFIIVDGSPRKTNTLEVIRSAVLLQIPVSTPQDHFLSPIQEKSVSPHLLDFFAGCFGELDSIF